MKLNAQQSNPESAGKHLPRIHRRNLLQLDAPLRIEAMSIDVASPSFELICTKSIRRSFYVLWIITARGDVFAKRDHAPEVCLLSRNSKYPR
jgi:hypothetical protein